MLGAEIHFYVISFNIQTFRNWMLHMAIRKSDTKEKIQQTSLLGNCNNIFRNRGILYVKCVLNSRSPIDKTLNSPFHSPRSSRIHKRNNRIQTSQNLRVPIQPNIQIIILLNLARNMANHILLK